MARDTYRILFVWTHNSARSIIAEAVLRTIGGDAFEAYSAGSEPVATGSGPFV